MPASFHGYEVEQQIGAGGMSTVFLGVHKTLGYKVAIKILHPALSMDQHFIARFEREARAASSLASSSIARVIDYGEEAGVYYIVMEYVEGKDLGLLFRELQAGAKRPVSFPVEITLLLLEDIAYGLLKAHEQNIIHRDIKPSNVLLSNDGEVKLVDFGLARDMRLSPGELTHTGMVIGTPSYMSPEQAAGSKKLDARTDIFTLGVMAYQLLTGEKPFKGETASEIQEIIIKSAPPPLTLDRCPLLTPEIASFVTRCLEKDPDKRYRSMKRVVEALSNCLESVDESGDLIRRRRSLLSGFLSDPQGVSAELMQRAISLHLKRGLLYKSMGREKLGDAERELRRVLYLDPGNKKATVALAELETPEETKVSPASDRAEEVEPTKILDPGQQPSPQQSIPVKSDHDPAGSGKAGFFSRVWRFAVPPSRSFVIGVLLVVVLATAVMLLWSGGRSDRRAEVAVVQEVLEESLPVVDLEPAEETVLLPPQVESEPVQPPQKSFLILELPERLEIYLDGRRVRTGTGRVELEVEPDRRYAVEVRNPRAHARLPIGPFSVEPGASHSIGSVDIPYGTLSLVAGSNVEIKLNGVLQAESTRKIERMRLGAGRHTLTVTAPEGYRVERASMSNADGVEVPLEPFGGDGREARYSIDVPRNGDLDLVFLVR